MLKHVNIRVYGVVQGVFFRKFTKLMAEKFNVKGFVQNEEDGSVYIEAEAEPEDLDKLVEWCHKGPEKAKVEEVKVEPSVLKGFENFTIKRY